MVDENLTDEQQADRIRQWFRENGMVIVGGLGFGLLALLGWDQWRSARLGQAEEASNLYADFVDRVEVNNRAAAEALLDELVADHDGSPYVDQARLRLARWSLDNNDFDTAADILGTVADAGVGIEIRQVAAIRLARVRLQQQRYDDALAALERVRTDSAAFPRANEVRGDIYYAQQRNAEALAAYDAALTDSRQPPTIDRAYVTAKRDNLAAKIARAPDTGADSPAPAAD